MNETMSKPMALGSRELAAEEALAHRQRTAIAQAMLTRAGAPSAGATPAAPAGDGGWMTLLAGALSGVSQGMQSRQGGGLFGSSTPPTKSWRGLSPGESTFDMDKGWGTGFGLAPMDGGGKG